MNAPNLHSTKSPLKFGPALTFLLANLLLHPIPAPAQPPGKPQDPLMTLMLSQPRIDIDSVVKAEASFDPPAVRPGESAVYRVTFSALEESITWPAKLNSPNLDLRPSAHGQILMPAGGVLQPHTSFNYRVRPTASGQFTVPEFTVTVYDKLVTVPAAQIEVTNTAPAPTPAVPHLELDIPTTNLFVGQSVRVRILLPGIPNGPVQMLSQGTAQLTGDGFVVDQGAVQQRIEPFAHNGAMVPTFIHETILTPVKAGKIPVFAQGFANNRFSGQIIISGTTFIQGGPSQFALLDTEPIELNVRPLPHEGELSGFTGAIGSFTVEPPSLSTNELRAGSPVKLTVTIRSGRGESSLARLIGPPPPRLRNWQVFTAPGDGASPAQIQARGFATFNYNLIPLSDEIRATPPIPFSYFDPLQGRYADLTIPSVPVTVAPGAVPGDLKTLLQPGLAAADTESEPILRDLAAGPGRTAASLVPIQQQIWFPLLQLAPAVAFAGLWGWDRRRRYLEHHPEVLLRRRARRALHREWRAARQAARAGDAPRFAAAAVSAMRVACAPHYPAEPRALVGGDVLAVLDSTASSGGQEAIVLPSASTSTATAPTSTRDLVRRFFALTDAAQYDVGRTDARELLAREPEIEKLLQDLEARL